MQRGKQSGDGCVKSRQIAIVDSTRIESAREVDDDGGELVDRLWAILDGHFDSLRFDDPLDLNPLDDPVHNLDGAQA